MTITIEGELTDLNAYIKSLNRNRYGGNEVKQVETDRVAWQCKRWRGHVDTFPVIITYHWYSKNRRMDIDNVAFAKKFVNDGLVTAGVLPNDSRKYVGGFADRFSIDKHRPRVEVTIESATL